MAGAENETEQGPLVVTEEVVRKVAELAQLQVDEEDIPILAAGMRNILELAQQLQAVDTAGAAPVANPLDATQRLRPDVITETDRRELFQSLAPAVEEGLYLVPRVID